MSEKFTAGPWRADGERVRLQNELLVTCWVQHPKEQRLPGEPWLDMHERMQPDRDAAKAEARANAHLIAASPDLYDALQHLLQVIDSAGLLNLSNGVQLGPTVWYVKASEAVDIANATLAKARGEASK